MRIDILLNKLCIVKTRSIAKNACDKNVILINGKISKASAEVKVDDIITIHMFGKINVIKIKKIPDGNVAKRDVLDFYDLLESNIVQ